MITIVEMFLAVGIAGYLLKRSLIGRTIMLCFRITKAGLIFNYQSLEKVYKYLNSKIATKSKRTSKAAYKRAVNESSPKVVYLKR
jgi:hypothetical protein